jgi:hypothetical protein
MLINSKLTVEHDVPGLEGQNRSPNELRAVKVHRNAISGVKTPVSQNLHKLLKNN